MPGVSNDDIWMKLGEVTEGISGLRRDMGKADESRKVLYERSEAQSRIISDLQFEWQKENAINGQIREEIKGFHTVQDKMSTDIAPLLTLKEDIVKMVDNWGDIRKSSQRIVWLLSLGGISIVGGFVWFGGVITQAVQQWLGIVPPH